MTVLKHEVDEDGFNATPENLRPLYTAVEGEDGKWHIPESQRGVADAITGLFTANGKIRKENGDLKKRTAPDLSAFSDYGDNVEDIHSSITAKIAELEEAVATASDGKVNLDKMKATLEKAQKEALDRKEAEIDGLRGSLSKHLITSSATAALAAEKGSVKLAMPFIQQQMKVIEESPGDFRAVVLDGDGEPRISGATGELMTVGELVREMKGQEDFARLFESEAKGGGGAPPRLGRKPSTVKAADMSAIDKIGAGLAKRA